MENIIRLYNKDKEIEILNKFIKNITEIKIRIVNDELEGLWNLNKDEAIKIAITCAKKLIDWKQIFSNHYSASGLHYVLNVRHIVGEIESIVQEIIDELLNAEKGINHASLHDLFSALFKCFPPLSAQIFPHVR
jgi:hypothetical protein